MCLNHPETIPLPLVCGKIVYHETSHWHQKRLGTANLSLCHTLNSRSQTHFPGFRLYKLEKNQAVLLDYGTTPQESLFALHVQGSQDSSPLRSRRTEGQWRKALRRIRSVSQSICPRGAHCSFPGHVMLTPNSSGSSHVSPFQLSGSHPPQSTPSFQQRTPYKAGDPVCIVI